MKIANHKIGILITNVGTPEAPTKKAVRNYLNEFLSDRRIIKLSPLLWQPLLKGIILPWRSSKSAKLYQKIWTQAGSPLLVNTQELAQGIQNHLSISHQNYEFKTVIGMHYGNPSITSALKQLKQFAINKILILPLFPQYSATTTASSFDAISKNLQTWNYLPQLNFINHYYHNENYINSLAASINNHWKNHGKNQHLLFSFHGIPKAYIDAGDVYAEHCHQTTHAIIKKLGLAANEWSIAFQSRFGKQQWLKPYCIDVLKQLPQDNINSVDVVCPGFAVDCLETLEEIAKTNKNLFLKAGGEKFNYIPALNASSAHIELLSNIVMENVV